MSTLQPESSSLLPLLLYECRGGHRVFNPTGEGQNHGRSIPELRGKEAVATFPGWLLLHQIQIDDRNQNQYYSLWNPTTFESIDMPPLKHQIDIDIDDYVLKSDDDGSEKKLTLLLFATKLQCIYVYRHDDDDDGCRWRWKSIPYAREIAGYYNPSKVEDCLRPLSQPVYCGGKLYALTHHNTKLVEIQIDFDKEEEEEEEESGLNIKSLGCIMPSICYRNQPVGVGLSYPYATSLSMCLWETMVENQGKLFWIVVQFGGIDLKEIVSFTVFMLNFSSWTWVKLDSLEDSVLFLSMRNQASFGLKAQQEQGQNRIYFIRLDDEYLYCYNMDDNTISVSLPCGTNLPTPSEPPLWVLPNPNVGDSTPDSNSDTEKEEEEEDKETEMKTPSFSPHAAMLVCPGYKKAKNTWGFIDPTCSSSKYTITAPQLLEEATIQCSKDAWLLLSCSKDQTQIVFFNPFTNSMIQLPPLVTRAGTQVGYAFSSSPTCSDCITIAITWLPDKPEIHIFSGGNVWVGTEFDSNSSFKPNWNNPVFWNGGVYFLDQDGKLGVLHIHEEGSHDWQVLGKPETPTNSFRQNFLVECGGELLSVFVGYMGRKVEVFKLNLSESKWDKVDNLAGHVLFLSRSTSFSAVAKSRFMENTIFFPRFRGESLVYYSLGTGKFHSVGCDDSFLDYSGTKEQLQCGWIQPA